MTKPSITTDLDRDPAWWSAWFDEDYSWDGLAKKDWQGWVVVEGRCVPKEQAPEGQDWPQASVQDYWRADPDNDWILRDMPAPGDPLSDAELIDLGGTIWHRAHLPPATQAGELSWKADPEDERFEAYWETLTTDLQTRMEHGFETQVNWFGRVKGPDGRLQGAGLVLKSLPRPGQNEETPLHLSMPRACFLGDIWMDHVHFGPGARFDSASFGGDASFQSASFGGDADFDSASFGGDARFHSAVFLAGVGFQRGSAPAQAAGRLMRGLTAQEAVKSDPEGQLEDTDYTLVLTHGAAKRETGAFKGFDFSNVICLGDVDFSDRGFGIAPDFQHSRFYGRADFHKSDMHEGVKLTGAQFRLDDSLEVLSWRVLVTHFSDQVAPFRVPFGPHRYGPVKLGEKRHLPFWYAAQKVWKTYHDGTCQWSAPGKAVIETASDFPAKLVTAMLRARPAVRPLSDHRHLTAPAEYEASYRRLKRIMASMGSHIEEQRFFALELVARQQRPDVKVWERTAARAYGLIADYGRSAVRPVLALASVFALMATLYSGLALSAGALKDLHWPQVQAVSVQARDPEAPPYRDPPIRHRGRDALLQAASGVRDSFRFNREVLAAVAGPIVFSAEITLAPVADPIRHHDWAQDLKAAGPGWSAAFSFLRLLHRVLAIPLIFLFALALRRRFQLG